MQQFEDWPEDALPLFLVSATPTAEMCSVDSTVAVVAFGVPVQVTVSELGTVADLRAATCRKVWCDVMCCDVM